MNVHLRERSHINKGFIDFILIKFVCYSNDILIIVSIIITIFFSIFDSHFFHFFSFFCYPFG